MSRDRDRDPSALRTASAEGVNRRSGPRSVDTAADVGDARADAARLRPRRARRGSVTADALD
jgi:hypothetical protein